MLLLMMMMMIIIIIIIIITLFNTVKITDKIILIQLL